MAWWVTRVYLGSRFVQVPVAGAAGMIHKRDQVKQQVKGREGSARLRVLLTGLEAARVKSRFKGAPAPRRAVYGLGNRRVHLSCSLQTRIRTQGAMAEEEGKVSTPAFLEPERESFPSLLRILKRLRSTVSWVL